MFPASQITDPHATSFFSQIMPHFQILGSLSVNTEGTNLRNDLDFKRLFLSTSFSQFRVTFYNTSVVPGVDSFHPA
jgi:hypothetical protein